MDHIHHSQAVERQPNRGRWVLIGFLAIAAIFLWTEYREHLLGILPYLLVLACPLMHLFHHHGHRHHGSGNSPESGNGIQGEGRMGNHEP
jgi:hypothetical protein